MDELCKRLWDRANAHSSIMFGERLEETYVVAKPNGSYPTNEEIIRVVTEYLEGTV